MPIYVIPTVPTDHISTSLADELGDDYEFRNPEPHSKNRRFFVSGPETYVKVPAVVEMQRRPVHVVHSGYSKIPINDGLEHLRQVLYALDDPRLDNETKLEKPSRVHLHMLSFPYGKQDYIWEPGEVNRAMRLCQELLPFCDTMTVIAPHFQTRNWSRELLDSGRVTYISPYKMLCERIAIDHPSDDGYKLISPGKFARFEGIDTPLVCTSRIEDLDVRIDGDLRKEDYEDQDVILADDISLTGTTLLRFGTVIRRMRPRYFALALPHIATDDAMAILRREIGYDAIYTTNACNVFEYGDYVGNHGGNQMHIIGIEPTLARQIRKIDQEYDD